MPEFTGAQINVKLLAVAFLLWTAMWAWLIIKRRPKISFGKLMVIFSGYAIIAGLAGPTGQWWLVHLQDHALLTTIVVAILAGAVLWVNSRM